MVVDTHFFKLVVSTPLKNMSQNGNLPQVGVKMFEMFETDHLGSYFLGLGAGIGRRLGGWAP